MIAEKLPTALCGSREALWASGKIVVRKCEIPLYKFFFSGIMYLLQFFIEIIYGPVAQLGERRVRNAEVEGSNPFGSTKMP